MARKSKPAPHPVRASTRAKLLLLAQVYTTAQISRLIGVSPRSIRRWKNESKEPSSAPRAKRLQKAFTREREAVQAEGRRDRKKHPRAIKRAALLPVRGTRRKLKERVIDKRTGEAKATGREVDSDWINYDVRGWNVREIHALMVQIWKSGGNLDMQFIFQMPAGSRAVDSGGKKSGNIVEKSTRGASAPFPLSRAGTSAAPMRLIHSETELLDLLLRFVDMKQGPKSPHMLYIAVNDSGVKKAPKKRKKKK